MPVVKTTSPVTSPLLPKGAPSKTMPFSSIRNNRFMPSPHLPVIFSCFLLQKITRKALCAERQRAALTGFFQSLNTDVPQTFSSNLLADFIKAHFIGDQVFAAVNIRSIM